MHQTVVGLHSNGATAACLCVVGGLEGGTGVAVGSRDGTVTLTIGAESRTVSHSPPAAFGPSSPLPSSSSLNSSASPILSAVSSPTAAEPNNINANANTNTNAHATSAQRPGSAQRRIPMAVSALGFSAPLSLLASGGEDGTLVVWTASAAPLTLLRLYATQAHQLAVSCVVWDAASGLVYTASFDKLVCVWDARAGRRVAALQGHTRPVLALALSLAALASAGMDGFVRIWDTTSRVCLHVLQTSPTAAIPLNTLPMTTAATTTISTSSASSNASSISDVLALSAGLNALYVGSRDGSLQVWNLAARKCVSVLTLNQSTIKESSEAAEIPYTHPEPAETSTSSSIVDTIQRRASNLPGLTDILPSSISKTLFGDPASSSSVTAKRKPSAVRTICIGSPNSPGQVFCAGDDGIIYEWDVKKGAVIREIDCSADGIGIGVLWIQFVPDQEAERLFVVTLDGCVRAFDLAKRFTKDHEWISVADGVGTFGITDYAQKALGDVVFIELPEIGKVFAKKENISAVESVKAASDIYAPVSGEVIAVNTDLADEPSLINSSPETDAFLYLTFVICCLLKAWIAKIKLSNPAEFEALLDEAAYAKLTTEE
ncbi:hypothetical protein HK100_002919 [Physocladia obscura]|uniref:Lipoyl-binding domain-containing protein n=1 Tax=Physocladia obscura TaxID=109957 RepID=A0AAD5XF21_9FUNG|nr:hypothetical protein HK100_002919 [Physocladia obscura]